jgi:hypothetical protein
MATRYIEAPDGSTQRNLVAPPLPNVAGLVYNQDTGQLEVNPPGSTAAWKAVPDATTAVQTLRTRVTTAQANAGIDLLPAIPGYSYQVVDMMLIAIGGNAATATSVRIRAVQATSAVSLLVALIAALTRSTIAKPNSANVSVLADGASFIANDVNTAISLDVDNDNLATATHIDVTISYVLVAG